MGVKHVPGRDSSAESAEPALRPAKKAVEGRSSQDESSVPDQNTVRQRSNAALKTASDQSDPNAPSAFSPATEGVHPPPYAADINMAAGRVYPEWACMRRVTHTANSSPMAQP